MLTHIFRHLCVLSKWTLIYYYGSESGFDLRDLEEMSRPLCCQCLCCDFLLPSPDCNVTDVYDAAMGWIPLLRHFSCFKLWGSTCSSVSQPSLGVTTPEQRCALHIYLPCCSCLSKWCSGCWKRRLWTRDWEHIPHSSPPLPRQQPCSGKQSHPPLS